MQPWHFWGPNLFEGLRLKPCLNPALTGPPTLSCVYAVNGVVADDSFFAMADGRRRRHSSMDRFLRLITRTKHFRWWNVFILIILLVFVWWRAIKFWSFWSRFDVNRSIFDEDMKTKKRFLHFYLFVPSDLDLWLLDRPIGSHTINKNYSD